MEVYDATLLEAVTKQRDWGHQSVIMIYEM
jgi:hypothetical protein